MIKQIGLLVLILAALTSASLPVKHLAGDPSTFTRHRIEPVSVEARNALIHVHFEPNNGLSKLLFSTQIPVSSEDFYLLFGSTFVDNLDLHLVSPSGKQVKLAFSELSVPVGDSSSTFAMGLYDFVVEELGFYTLSITGNGLSQEQYDIITNNVSPDGVLYFASRDGIMIETEFTSSVLAIGEPIGLRTHLLEESLENVQGSVRVTRAIMDVVSPDGRERKYVMNDDGIYGDLVANDGQYSAVMMANEFGTFEAQAVVTGIIVQEDGTSVPFVKSSQHVIQVATSKVDITGAASMRKMDAERVLIDLDVSYKGELGSYRTYSEVWGVDHSTGEARPAAWIGSVVEINDNTVTMELNLKWLARAGVQGPLVLKNTFLADMDTNFPVGEYLGDIVVENSQVQYDSEHKHILSLKDVEITEEMEFGINPLAEVPYNKSSASLILLHGYCAGDNPFKGDESLFSNAGFFYIGAAESFSNDAFSKKVVEYTNSIGSSRFSLAGHSQGGMVSVHLANYYWSGADLAENGRVIQSVGTPWKGCSAAGDVAALGQALGITCGKNNDLTVSGAETWYKGIHSSIASKVSFYTSTYGTGSFDNCNFFMNILLYKPNDGTTEERFAKLDGATNMGNTQKECHTTGMKYPPQTSNKQRNAKINAEAAR